MAVPATAPEVVRDGNVTVVTLGSHFKIIDEHALEGGIGESLLEIAASVEPAAVVLDLSEVQFFGSSFIEILLRVWNRLNERSGRFAICSLCENCDDVLKVTHLDTLWPVYPTRRDAIADLSVNIG
jgi:anti-anti-sigma factor